LGGTGNLTNCIVVDNDTSDIGDATVVEYACSPNVIHGAWGSITNAPLFDGVSFRLRDDSPCIDVGIEYGSITLDYDGFSRILDGDGVGTPAARPDLGAFEFCSSDVDTDSDGLSDSDEAWVYHSDPEDDDTDNDGREDGDEVSGGLCPTVNEASAIAWGEDNVTGNPAYFGQYSEQSLRNTYPDRLIANVEGGEAVVQLQPQIAVGGPGNSWTDIGAVKTWRIPAEVGAAFYRISGE